jgi:hypothetical protein
MAAAAGVVALALVGATVLRHHANLTPAQAAARDGYAGYLALLAGQDMQAAALLAMAVRLDGRRTQDWFNLGLALSRLDFPEPARQAFNAAARLRQPASGYPAR